MGKKLITDIQQRFTDVDSFGHVNNTHMQDYYDLGKTEFYRKVLGSTMSWHKDSIVIVSIHSDYLSQTRYGEDLYVETAIEKIGNRSFTFIQKIINRDNGQVHSVCHTVMVGFNFEQQTSMPLLPVWVECLKEYLVEDE